MRYLDGKFVSVDGKKMALLYQSNSGWITVEPLNACSVGTHLAIITWLRELGYAVK